MQIVIDNRPTEVVIQEQADRIADLENALRDVIDTMRVCQVQYPPTTFVYDQLEIILQKARVALDQDLGERGQTEVERLNKEKEHWKSRAHDFLRRLGEAEKTIAQMQDGR